MKPEEHVWSIVLAAGAGSRVRSLTRAEDGEFVPKQFWALDGRESLLERTLRRVERVVDRERIVVVVAEEHAAWWQPELAWARPENLLVQPRNRGTAPGVFFPLLSILRRDPMARVVLFPSDHTFEREEIMLTAVREALAVTARAEADIVLLGMVLDEVALDCGWIVPTVPTPSAVSRVAAIVEKPEPTVAAELLRRGAIVNSMMLAASGKALARAISSAIPELAIACHERLDRANLERIYTTLPSCDFTRDVLQRCARSLFALAVRQSGWLDVGVPERWTRFLSARPAPA